MEVIFGVQARDGAIRVQLDEEKVSELKTKLEAALGGSSPQILWVTDKDGREIGIPTDKIAFIEFGTERAGRQVGFSSAS